MKNIIITSLFCICYVAMAQTNSTKNRIYAGFGFQQYNGDLGNTFFATDEEWYGVGRISYSRYLNRAFNVNIFATLGDFGHCFDGPQDPLHPVLNMRSRLKTLGISAQFNLANGFILPVNCRLNPYVYAGIAMNSLHDIWSGETRVNAGNYSSINGGLGLDYRLARSLHVAINTAFGRFNSDKLDFISKGTKDMYMQNTLSLGIDL